MKITLYKNNIKSVFVLEDNEQRIEWFTKMFSFVPELIFTKKAGEAIEILKAKKFDILFLDHDLDDQVYVDSHMELDEGSWNTGYQVAKVLRDTINKETPCIIHSMNPTGAANMVQAHPFNTAHIPFWMLKDSLEVTDDSF